MEETKSRGGARAGAGRPKGSKNRIPAEGRKTLFKSITVSGYPEEITKIQEAAAKAGMSVSRYIINRCLG